MNFIDKLRIKNLNMRQYVLGSYDGDFEGIEEIVTKARLKITYNGGVELQFSYGSAFKYETVQTFSWEEIKGFDYRQIKDSAGKKTKYVFENMLYTTKGTLVLRGEYTKGGKMGSNAYTYDGLLMAATSAKNRINACLKLHKKYAD